MEGRVEQRLKLLKLLLNLDKAEGKLYNDSQKSLMILYAYLFLTRGKPSTHILALSDLDKNAFDDSSPEPLKKIVEAAKEKLKDDPFSRIFTERIV